ncbi:MAG TPA: hypothetical protein VNB22_02870 [Pyrinomonadaceae bacterium]|jgi:hypothetical protein|nr:hypothetical protein [Pyrinomonadaceae bacterium]
MKLLLFVLTLFFVCSTVFAQTSETVSELMRVPENIGKFSKRQPNRKLKFDAKVELVNLPNGKKGIAASVQTPYREIVFWTKGGIETAQLNIYLRITSQDETLDGFFEERLEEFTTAEILAGGWKKESANLRKVFELPEGKYQIGIIVRDITTGYRNAKIIKFQIS